MRYGRPVDLLTYGDVTAEAVKYYEPHANHMEFTLAVSSCDAGVGSFHLMPRNLTIAVFRGKPHV